MEESLFINLEGNKILLQFIKEYEQRMEGENSTTVVLSEECQQERPQLRGDANEQNGFTKPMEHHRSNEGKTKGGKKNLFMSENDKLHLLQCLGRASFTKEGTLDGCKKKENVFRYHSFCINGGDKVAMQRGSHASSQKLNTARGGPNRTANKWLRSQQKSVKLVSNKASPEKLREELRETQTYEEDNTEKQLHPSRPPSTKDIAGQPRRYSQLYKKDQHTLASPNGSEKRKKNRQDILHFRQNNNSSRSVQISKGKKKEKNDFKNDYSIGVTPAAVHAKKSSPNLCPPGGNPSRTTAVHSAEWVKKEGMKNTMNRAREGLTRGAGLKLRRGRALVGKANLVGGHLSRCGSYTRSGPHRGKKNPTKWEAPSEGGKEHQLSSDEQNKHTTTSHVEMNHSFENSLILTVSSTSPTSRTPPTSRVLSPSSSSSSSTCNVIYSVSSYDKEGTRKSSTVVRCAGDVRKGGHTKGRTRHCTLGRGEPVKVNKNISRFVPPCEMNTQEEEFFRRDNKGGETRRQNEPLDHAGRSDEDLQTVRRKKGKGKFEGKRKQKTIPSHGMGDKIYASEKIDSVEEMCHIVRYKKTLTKMKKKILNRTKKIREVHQGRVAEAEAWRVAGGHPRRGEFAQFVKRAKRVLEDRQERSTRGQAPMPGGRDKTKRTGDAESYQREDTCELFLRTSKNEALLRRYMDRKKNLMNHMKTYILIHQRKHQKECSHERRGASKGKEKHHSVVEKEVDSEERKKNERIDQPGVEVKEGECSHMINAPHGEHLQMVVTPMLSETEQRSPHGYHPEKTDALEKQPCVEAHENEKNEQEGKLKKSEMNLEHDKGHVKKSILGNGAFEEKLVHAGRFSCERMKEFLNGSDVTTKEVVTTHGWKGAHGNSSLCPSHFNTLTKAKHKINAMKSGKMFLCSSENTGPRQGHLREVRLKNGTDVRLATNLKTDLLDNCAALVAFVRSQLRRVNSAITGRRFALGGCFTETTPPTKCATTKRVTTRNQLRSLRRNVKGHLEKLRRTKIVSFILSVLREKSDSSCTPTCSEKP
ncbi:hypothetical protein AK88_00480 [Plasmodium fragile]|uniref:Uncharacterized protein n=1 Tax=Plasmodium fragile TaxID=5857 RepID=A0A0D9QSI7_PLAFR|nr:uncharacterized protein AK88_00480 [Plasmodium fragile]KJP89772.1 hypothetical protein AK88_00480 [Plasmodium fragile]